MVAEAELNVSVLQEMVGLIRRFHEYHNVDLDCSNLLKIQEDMKEVLAAWRSKQSEKHAQNLELQQQVALAERKLVSAKMDNSNNDELERVREQLEQTQIRETQMQTDVKKPSLYLRSEIRAPTVFPLRESERKAYERELSIFTASGPDLEECIEAIEEQMISIKLQKETLEKPDADEAFLKNELSLFLNVSSILPDLGDPKFSGTFVDKQRGVKTFKFSSADMSPFQTCQAAWDMMK